MRKLFVALSVTFTIAMWVPVQAQQSPFIEDFIERIENSRIYTIQVAEAMPEENYSFKATPEEMSFAENLLHIGFAMNWHGQTLIGEQETPNWQNDTIYKTASKSKADIIKVVDETFDKTISTLKEFDPAYLDTQLEYFGLQRSKRQIFLMLADHITHHRGQILVYLRLNGIVPPRYVLYQ